MNDKNNTQTKTKLSRIVQQKINYIYQTLIKLGCTLMSEVNIEKKQEINLYFQPTDARLELIQWLIATIYPGYKLDGEYKNCYDDDPHIAKIKKYSIILWQIGVMPMSKFTKNLDYRKYVQGLLGYQSAINLIYDLTELGQQKFSSNIKKIQENATELLGDLIKYNGELVNIEYDPYGVTFPSKYQNNEEDCVKIKQEYNQIVEQMEAYNKQSVENQQIISQQGSQECGRLLGQLQDYKQLLSRKYGKLKEQIMKVNRKYEKIIPESTGRKQISALHESRMLNISKNLSKSYREYKNMISNVRQQTFLQNIKELRTQAICMINSINQVNLRFQ